MTSQGHRQSRTLKKW